MEFNSGFKGLIHFRGELRTQTYIENTFRCSASHFQPTFCTTELHGRVSMLYKYGVQISAPRLVILRFSVILLRSPGKKKVWTVLHTKPAQTPRTRNTKFLPHKFTYFCVNHAQINELMVHMYMSAASSVSVP